MTEILSVIGLLLVGYLLGSIPSAVWIGKAWHDVDVREHGSGNAGATNTFRVLGVRTGIVVLLADIIKGFLAVNLVRLAPDLTEYGIHKTDLQIAFGISAVIGHIWPIFAGFRGGKGIATLLGMVIGLDYRLALICVGVFIVILLTTRFVSLGSMLATITFPIAAAFILHRTEPSLIGFGIAASVLVVVTHRKNIGKLLKGVENKANIFNRQSA